MLVQHLQTQAEYDDESSYTLSNQPASYYDSTLYMLSASHGEPRRTSYQIKGLSLALTTIVYLRTPSLVKAKVPRLVMIQGSET